MNKSWRIAALIAGTGLLIWVVAGIVLAGRGILPALPSSQQPIRLRGGHVVGTHMSSKNWTFDYKSAQISADGTLATIDGLRKGILYRDGRPYLSLSAEHASVNTRTFDFTAVGQVHIAQLDATGSGRSFDTDYIQWISATKMLTLPHPSIVRTNGELLRVASITVDFNRSLVRFGAVTGGVSVP